MRPLIGVTTSEMRPSSLATTRRHGEPPHPEMALGMTYLRTLDAAGAIPVVLPPVGTDHLQGLLERLDGICLSGGPDLDPAAYGATDRHTQPGPTEPSLDAFELSLAREALSRNIPILAICRGSQALNVACGGTLHQHIDGHRQTATATEPTHAVAVETGSRLHRIMRQRHLSVNSFHHQAVDSLGDGLVATAWAPDGTIEGIEDPRHPFLLGVQWHAETLTEEPGQLALFAALVEAATAHSAAAARGSTDTLAA